jgi:hypothetical protein
MIFKKCAFTYCSSYIQTCMTDHFADEKNKSQLVFLPLSGQLDTVKSLQVELCTASDENRALVKEMEMLNAMFIEMERTHVKEALKEYQGGRGEHFTKAQSNLLLQSVSIPAPQLSAGWDG